MPARNVNLTDHFDQFIQAGVESGRFSNASEVVREGLRLLEQREQEDRAKVEWLRTAANQAFNQIDRGEGTEFPSADALTAYIDQVGEKVEAERPLKRRRA